MTSPALNGRTLGHREAGAHSPGGRRSLTALAVACLALATLLGGYLAFGVEALTLTVPIAACAVGVACFTASGPLYVEYMVWAWFLAPFLRRVVDYSQGAYTPSSLIIAAPVLVGAISALPLLGDLVRGRVAMSSPFVLPLLALVSAFGVGALRNGATAAGLDLLSWGVPVVVGYHVASNWEQFPEYRRRVQRAFLWGGGLLGAYGVWQFLYLPPWDAMWMSEAGMNSIGRAEPLMVRVFGTLNAPGPYATALMASLVLGTAGRKNLLAGPALVGLLLSLVRGAWGGFALAVAWIAVQAPARERVRLLAVVAVVATAIAPLLLLEPVAARIDGRMDTLSELGDDRSAQVRTQIYTTEGPRRILAAPLGEGLGAIGTAARVSGAEESVFDSGLLGVPLVLGIPGVLLYYAGLARLAVAGVGRRQSSRFLRAASGVVLAVLAMLVFVNQLTDFSGMLLWMCIGLIVAGRAHSASTSELV